MKKTLALVLSIVMMLSVVAIAPIGTHAAEIDSAQTAETYYSGDYKYVLLSDGTAEITGYTGYSTDVKFPSTIDGYKVTSMGSNVIGMYSGVTSVTIPYGVTNIANNAFYSCGTLLEVTIPNSVKTIGNYAFAYCEKLTEVVIPDSVTTLGDYVFDSCRSLTKVTLGKSITSIGKYAFYYCSALENVTIPGSVKSIGDRAFGCCYAFTEITIPESVESIGNSAFEYCKMDSITIENPDCTIGEAANTIPNSTIIIAPSGSKAEEYANNNGNNFNSTTPSVSADFTYQVLSDGTAEITGYIGSETRIEIPETIDGYTVTSIGVYAFYECKNLKYIGISDTVETIEDYAFHSCESLTSIFIPASVTSIGKFVFNNCKSLYKIKVDLRNPTYISRNNCQAILQGNSVYEYELLYGCMNTNFYQATSSRIANNAFYGCVGLEYAFIRDDAEYIGDYAFYGCTNLEYVIIENPDCQITDSSAVFPANTVIAGQAGSTAQAYAEKYNRKFVVYDVKNEHTSGDYKYRLLPNNTVEILKYVGSAADIVIPSKIDGYTVTIIGNNSFSDYSLNSNIESVVIPNTVTTIGSDVFFNCTNLVNLSIPDSVTSIGEQAFENIGISTLHISKNVTFIDGAAFAGCNQLVSITVDPENPVYDSRDNCNAVIFTDNNSLEVGCKNTVIPDTVTGIGYCAFFNCNELKELTIPDSVKYIDYSAFYYCGFEELVLPDSIEYIGSHAFYECHELKKITLPKYLKVIDGMAFSSCDELTEIEIPETVTYVGGCAFYNCRSLKEIVIPKNVENVERWALNTYGDLEKVVFYNPDCVIYDDNYGDDINEKATIYCYENSTAHQYALKYDRNFVLMEKKKPIKVENVHGTNIKKDEFTIEWDKLEEAVEYWVYVDGDVLDMTTSTSVVAPKRKSGQTYKVQVIAKLEDGTWFSLANADTVEITTLNKTANLRVLDVAEFEIEIAWDETPNAVGYWVYINDDEYQYTTDTSMLITKRVPETLYNISVVATFGDGSLFDVEDALVVTVTTDDIGPVTSTTRIDFPIPDEVKGANEAWILYGKDPKSLVTFNTIDLTKDSFRIANLDYDTDYYYAYFYKKGENDEIQRTTKAQCIHSEINETYDDIVPTITSEGKLVINWNQVNKTYKYWVFRNGVCLGEYYTNSALTFDKYSLDDEFYIEGAYVWQDGTRQFKYEKVKLSDVLK